MQTRTRLPAALAVSIMALITACGGGGTGGDGIASAGGARPTAAQPSAPNEARGKFYDAQLKYTQCMRRNGLPEFPDPLPSGYMDVDKANELYERLQSGSRAEMEHNQETKLGPAGKACDKLERAALAVAPRRNKNKDLEVLLKHARCMRKQGVDMTDPVLQNGVLMVGDTPNPTNPKVSRDSPEYKRAHKACRSLLPEGLYQ